MKKNGDNVDNEHWAPVGKEQNSWVQVGRREGQTCKTLKHLSHKDPLWGASGMNIFEESGYVMCCLEHSLLPVEAASTMPKDIYDVIEPVFNPILYDRTRGWEGSTYDEAVQFCSEKEPSRVLCPFPV